ncbi:MAG: hypothetical protein R3C69_13700 [Geminicoccaceae bacterium]
MLALIDWQRSRSHAATQISSSSVEQRATTSPVGATMQLSPISMQPSSTPHLATPTTQVPFW